FGDKKQQLTLGGLQREPKRTDKSGVTVAIDIYCHQILIAKPANISDFRFFQKPRADKSFDLSALRRRRPPADGSFDRFMIRVRCKAHYQTAEFSCFQRSRDLGRISRTFAVIRAFYGQLSV